jgi:hypothetical protein
MAAEPQSSWPPSDILRPRLLPTAAFWDTVFPSHLPDAGFRNQRCWRNVQRIWDTMWPPGCTHRACVCPRPSCTQQPSCCVWLCLSPCPHQCPPPPLHFGWCRVSASLTAFTWSRSLQEDAPEATANSPPHGQVRVGSGVPTPSSFSGKEQGLLGPCLL